MNEGQYCPHCGQPLPTGFATGTRSLSPDPRVRRASDIPDPDGPLGYDIIMKLGDGQSPEDIAENMDLTIEQVEGLQRHVRGTPNVRVHVARRHRTVEIEP